MFRLFIWYLFLWRVSRLKLALSPLHPDGEGGLGFLEESLAAYAVLLVAQSVLLAGAIANQIWHNDASLLNYRFAIAGFVALLILVVLLPLTFFALHLLATRRKGIREYGQLASEYTNEFERKWLRRRSATEEPLLGTADIQSLADLANSYEVVHKMRALPFTLIEVVRLAIVVALPFAPLALTLLSVEDLIHKLIKLLL